MMTILDTEKGLEGVRRDVKFVRGWSTIDANSSVRILRLELELSLFDHARCYCPTSGNRTGASVTGWIAASLTLRLMRRDDPPEKCPTGVKIVVTTNLITGKQNSRTSVGLHYVFQGHLLHDGTSATVIT